MAAGVLGLRLLSSHGPLLNPLPMSRSIRRITTLMLFVTGLASQAQQLVPTKGKEFWMGFMQNYLGQADMILYISSDVATTGLVSIPLSSWQQNFTVNA